MQWDTGIIFCIVIVNLIGMLLIILLRVKIACSIKSIFFKVKTEEFQKESLIWIMETRILLIRLVNWNKEILS